MERLIFAILAVVSVFIASFGVAAFNRMNRWNRTYVRLAKRYAGKRGNRGGAVYGYGITKPSLTFNYGRTFCSLRNRKSFRFPSGRLTEISMIWPNRKLRMEISTSRTKSRSWGPGGIGIKQVFIEDPKFQADYYISASDSQTAAHLMSSGVQWQIEQLRRLGGNNEIVISISRGSLTVGKPGYIKDYVALEDFVRLSLELFDQLMLVDAEGIEFVSENQATVVADVKCPICSEEIMHNMVVCSRCKTPHCQDCWQYNGQCATFACSETRCLHMGNVS